MAHYLRSGELKIDVRYNDQGFYKVRLCPVYENKCETVKVNPPRHLTRAVDSRPAMNAAARAAISFASDRIQNMAASDARGSGWVVRSPRNVRGPRRRRK